MAFKKPVNLKYQVDCGPKNVDFKSLASFFETIVSALMNKQEQLIVSGRELIIYSTLSWIWISLVQSL